MSEKPTRATEHCRHYSYERGLSGGPRCAAGIDLSEGGSTAPCMPGAGPGAICARRQEYTDAERTAWKDYVARRMTMLSEAVAAIPHAIPIRSEGDCPCPHCSGKLTWSRHSNGHVWLQCTTADCIGPVHFNIPRDRQWPVSKVAKP